MRRRVTRGLCCIRREKSDGSVLCLNSHFRSLRESAAASNFASGSPTHPAPTQGHSGGIVDASTLFATQILQRNIQTDGDAAVYREKK